MTAAQNASAEKVTGTEILIADPLETARTFEPIIFTLPVGCDAPLLWAELKESRNRWSANVSLPGRRRRQLHMSPQSALWAQPD